MTIESNRTLGGIGAILLVLFPFCGWFASGFSLILGLAGVILVLVGLNGLANEYRDRRVFNNALYGLILPIVGLIVAAVIFVVVGIAFLSAIGITISNWSDLNSVQQAFQNFNPDPTVVIKAILQYIGAIGAAALILFLTVVFGAFLFKRSLDALAEKSRTGLFSTAGLLMLIGAVLTIIVIGVFLIWISLILLAAAFFEMRTAPPAPQAVPPPPVQT